MSLIAYCGLDCSRCPAHMATLSGYEYSKGKIAQEWSKIYEKDIDPENIKCMGCKLKEGIHFSHCYKCSIRLCAEERNIDTCADCEEFACVDLKDFFELVPDARQNLEKLEQQVPRQKTPSE
ncbi:MAG: DUF3795 domain-containing protein [Candidatus Aegiribacteria sp.]|nr:DUF3795 domain-containing protein [Candidatus Aegiribacteria sp.]